MNIDLVISQIRKYAPIFGQRVAGAAQFAKVLQAEVNMVLPAAYVIPLEDEASENEDQNGLYQFVTERIGVVVEINNSGDDRGQASVTSVETIKTAIWSAILNWRIDPINAQRGLKYDGGRMLDIDRARIFWQYEFSLERIITDDDGFQVVGTPLTNIELIDTGIPAQPTFQVPIQQD